MLDIITLEEASVLWLKSLGNKSAFFSEELFTFLYHIKKTKAYAGKKVSKVRVDANLKKLFIKVVNFLEQRDLIESMDYRYFVIKNQNNDPLEIICSLYPYGYASYLTAMRVYNLTNRFPKAIDFIAPSRADWKQRMSQHFAENDIDDDSLSPNDFVIPYPSEVLRFKRKKLNVHTRKNLAPFVTRGEQIRVIEIGNLFLEMLRYPDNCGGFQHVFEIFTDMGEALSEEILVATESFGSNIDKSRIGYLFEKHLNISDDRINEWKKTSVSRGGSRKMIADGPYSNIYDEEWSISLNHDIFK